MEQADRSRSRPGDDEATAGIPEICAYATSPDRTVFTESGNGDGWIATDRTVEPTP